MAGAASARLSAPAYFIFVLLLTLAGFGAAMLARPAFGHAVLQWAGLEPVPRALPGSFYTVRVAPLFRDHCIGCHGENGDGKGPATSWINNPTPRNFTDVSAQYLFSDGEMYDAILFGVDGTAMPAWGDMLTVNDIWDVTNFLRTIPNGGLHRDPTADMMVSPGDYKPIELTPVSF